MASLRSAILTDLVAAFDTITVANGYLSNLATVAGGSGTRIHLDHTTHLGQGPIGVVLQPSSGQKVGQGIVDDSDQQNIRDQGEEFRIRAHAWVTYDVLAGETGWDKIDNLITDLETAAYVDPQRGARAIDTYLFNWDVDAPGNEEGMASAAMEFAVRYEHEFGKPQVATP